MQLTDLPVMSPDWAQELAYEIMCSASRDLLLQHPEHHDGGMDAPYTDRRMKELEDRSELDMVFTIPNMARVRRTCSCSGAPSALRSASFPCMPTRSKNWGFPLS